MRAMSVKIPDDLIDFTPEHARRSDRAAQSRTVGPMFTPPVVGNVERLARRDRHAATRAAARTGRAAAYDPETHIGVRAGAQMPAWRSYRCVAPPPRLLGHPIRRGEGRSAVPDALAPGTARRGCAPAAAPAGRHAPAGAAASGAPAATGGAGGGLTVQGLPIVKPPYGVIAAIDLDRGEMMWQVPHGDTPDNVRNTRRSKGMNIPKTGQSGSVGLVVTKTLVIWATPRSPRRRTHPRGAMLRAYDKATGKEVGAVCMPAPQSGSPMTYMWQRQAVHRRGGQRRELLGEYIAYALPDE